MTAPGPTDEAELARLFRLAAGQDDTDGPANTARLRRQAAQCRLAVMVLEGRAGLPRDEREAARLLRLAAADGPDGGPGHRDAQYFLAFMVLDGRGGLRQDEREAVRLWQEAAQPVSPSDWGHLGAQSILGLLCKDGLCDLPKDLDKARDWLMYPGDAVAEAYNGGASICLEVLDTLRPGTAVRPGSGLKEHDPLAVIRECFAHWVSVFPEVGHDTYDDSAASQGRFDRQRWTHVVDRLRDLLATSDPGGWDLRTVDVILGILVDIACFNPDQPARDRTILLDHPRHLLALAGAGRSAGDVRARHLLVEALGTVDGNHAEEATALLEAYRGDPDRHVRLRAGSVLARRRDGA